MKKILNLIIAICFSLLLLACGQVENSVNEDDAEDMIKFIDEISYALMDGSDMDSVVDNYINKSKEEKLEILQVVSASDKYIDQNVPSNTYLTLKEQYSVMLGEAVESMQTEGLAKEAGMNADAYRVRIIDPSVELITDFEIGFLYYTSNDYTRGEIATAQQYQLAVDEYLSFLKKGQA